jgi:hypothetical protein
LSGDVYWLHGRFDRSNYITINLAVSLQKIAHGEEVITLNPALISSYLRLSDQSIARLTKQFCLPRDMDPVRIKEKLDYPTLARKYKDLIEQGYFRNQAHLAGYLGVSRAWITKVLNKLPSS